MYHVSFWSNRESSIYKRSVNAVHDAVRRYSQNSVDVTSALAPKLGQGSLLEFLLEQVGLIEERMMSDLLDKDRSGVGIDAFRVGICIYMY